MATFFHTLKQSKHLRLLAKLGLTLAALWFVFHKVDFSRLGDMLRHQNPLLLVVAAILMSFQIPCGALRWQLILDALADGKRHLPTFETLKIIYITAFFNCCLPGTVGGDVVRVWLAKSDHIPLSQAIHSVIIDRFIALVALAVLVVAMLPVLSSMAGFSAMPVILVILAAIPLGVWVLFNLHRLLDRYRHIRFVHVFLYFTDSLLLLLKHRMSSFLSLSYGVVSHFLYCMGAYALARSLGVPVTALQCATLIPPVMLAAILPVSIGGWGLREAGMIGMMRLAGVPQAQALMVSIQLGVIPMIVSLPAGLLWLMRRKPAMAMNRV